MIANATLTITTIGEPLLRQAARPISSGEVRSAEFQEFTRVMRETMIANRGVGLAAPQVGHGIRLVVIEDSAEAMAHLPPERWEALRRSPIPFQVLINPVVLPVGDGRVEAFESCLSVFDCALWAVVERSASVRVEALDQHGDALAFDAHGWHARIVQHEVDHLNGTLFLDRMLPRTASNRVHRDERWKLMTAAEARRSLDAK